MTPKLLLVNAITLLFRESQIVSTNENSSELVRTIIQGIQLPEVTVGFDHERDILDGLKSTALYMCETPPGYLYELSDIMQRLKVNTLEEESLYDALCEGMVPELPEPALKRMCLNLKRTLNGHFREVKLNEIVGKAAYALKFSRNKITDMKAFVSELSSQLEPYMVDVITKDPAIITEVNMSKLDQITGVFGEVKNSLGGVSILRTGYQGINKMLGGGFRRGEEVVIGALQHKWKTGFSLNLFKQIAIYNTPVLKDPTKKPLLLRISAEDNLTLNFQFLYQSLKENETKKKADISGISDAEMAAYVQEKLAVNGYETRFMFINPSLWTYRDICNKVIELESEGYELHLVMIDYLAKIPTTGCDQTVIGMDVVNMYERIRAFMSSREITFITPHQLSTEAKMMIREGRTEFVKELPGRGYYQKTKQLDVVVDLEIFIHIEKVNGKSYLTVQRGKHRVIEQTPDEFHYCVLPFQDAKLFACGILDDINESDSTLSKPGSTRNARGEEEKPFWDES